MTTHHHAVLTILIVIALALFPTDATAQSGGLVPEDFYQEVGVGEVALSPDGALVAFTVALSLATQAAWTFDGGPAGVELRTS